MSNPTVAYSTFCCAKDKYKVVENMRRHRESHKYEFDENFLIVQRAGMGLINPSPFKIRFINDLDYPVLMKKFGIKYPDPVLDELTHGWDAAHFWAHHCVNHLKTALEATTDYVVFADGDCFMKETPEESWISEGISLLENHANVFVVSPNDGGEARLEHIMSQQMFLINRKRFLEMEFIPWDGTFIPGGPFQEYYGLMEGWIGRYMAKNGIYRAVLPPKWRYWHRQW